MSDFPKVVADDEGLWDRPTQKWPWLDENMHRFLFQLEDIRSGAIEFRYADRAAPNDSGIYFLQYDGDIVYVGLAKYIGDRLRSHWKSEKVWTHFWCITGVPIGVLQEVEYMYIQWLNPVLNVKCKGQTDIADRLIADLEPYEPFVGIKLVPVRDEE